MPTISRARYFCECCRKRSRGRPLEISVTGFQARGAGTRVFLKRLCGSCKDSFWYFLVSTTGPSEPAIRLLDAEVPRLSAVNIQELRAVASFNAAERRRRRPG